MTEAKLDPNDPQPGLYRDVPMETYLALPLLSASALEVFRRSPEHYRKRDAKPATKALRLGTAAHLALLEPLLFEATYIRGVPGDGRTKAIRQAREDLAHRFPEAEILNPEDFDAAIAIRDAIQAHPRARTLFEGHGEFEVTGIFEDPDTGILCKFRPDRLVARAQMVIDLKTAADASERAFVRSAVTLGYHRKLAFYRRGLRALDWTCTASAICAVESAPPHVVACYLMDEDQLLRAEADVARSLEHFRYCSTSDTWPGYGDEFRTLTFPDYAFDAPALEDMEIAA